MDSYKNFEIGTRLRKAADAIGSARIVAGIKSLYCDRPSWEKLVIENIGVDEERKIICLRISDLDISRLKEIETELGLFGRSVIIRNIIEGIVNSEEKYAQYRKAPGWKARPYSLIQGGKNPVPSIDGGVVNECYSIPEDIYQQIEFLTLPRGMAHLGQPSLASCFRDAILANVGIEDLREEIEIELDRESEKHGRKACAITVTNAASLRVESLAEYMEITKSAVVTLHLRIYLRKNAQKLEKMRQEIDGKSDDL